MPLPVIVPIVVSYSPFYYSSFITLPVLLALIAPMEAASFCDEQGEEQKIQRTAGGKEMSMGFPKCSLFKSGL